MRTIFLTNGIALIILSVFMLFPLVLELFLDQDGWRAFATSIILTCVTGISLIATNKNHLSKLNIRHCFLLTVSVWVVVCFYSALPFYFTLSAYHLDVTDSIFESMSGLTTTGSTVYIHLDDAPKGILLWRSLTEWFGGIGLIVFSMTILPYLRIGGMQLFQLESSEKSNYIIHDAGKLAKVICLVYLTLTGLNIVAYFLGGMTVFDAVNHALTTISTGGFSTHDLSFGYFESPTLQWIATFFMIAGGTPLLLYYTFFRGKFISRPLISQAKFLYKSLLFIIITLAIWLYFNSDFSMLESLRLCAFNIVSIVTTTGFATTDYSQWGNFVVVGIFLITMIGGCTGSTSGGIKIFRIQIILKYLNSYIELLIKPRDIFITKINYKVMDNELIKSTMVFLIMFIAMFLMIALGLALTGLDFITSLSGSATALANVGPGLGDVIGPAGNFSMLSDSAKYLLVFAMLAGRLEVLFIFVLLSKSFWINYPKENV